MRHRTSRPPSPQLSMPGMPEPIRSETVDRWSITPGQEVLYLGDVNGGPRYGSRGTVRSVLDRKAIVDLRDSGTWHIPYWFLGLPKAA